MLSGVRVLGPASCIMLRHGRGACMKQLALMPWPTSNGDGEKAHSELPHMYTLLLQTHPYLLVLGMAVCWPEATPSQASADHQACLWAHMERRVQVSYPPAPCKRQHRHPSTLN